MTPSPRLNLQSICLSSHNSNSQSLVSRSTISISRQHFPNQKNTTCYACRRPPLLVYGETSRLVEHACPGPVTVFRHSTSWVYEGVSQPMWKSNRFLFSVTSSYFILYPKPQLKDLSPFDHEGADSCQLEQTNGYSFHKFSQQRKYRNIHRSISNHSYSIVYSIICFSKYPYRQLKSSTSVNQ